ncbi:MAG: hypothetical protein M3256_23075, partial [Actinomycetota bacterium]|nr:hypothetical protein [Actinomycetota bacterium]
MDLADHFRVIWLHRWRVLLASAVIAFAVFAWSSTRPAVYRAKAVIAVTAGRAVSGDSVKEQDTVFLTRNYAELARTQPVLAQAVLKSGLHISPSEAGARITVVAASDVGFLTISADDSSEKAATAFAGAVADALIAATRDQQVETLRQSLEPVEEEVRQLESRLATLPAGGPEGALLEARYSALLQAATDRRLAPTDRLALVAPARADSGPVSPKPLRSAVLAFLAALVV